MTSPPSKKEVPKEGQELVVNCDENCLGAIRDFVRQKAGQAGLNRTDVGRLVLAADEASSNIIRHSYHFDWRHKIGVAWHMDKDRVVVEIRDDSPVPYLPSMADFDLPAKIKFRHSNGYGKYLIRNAVDDVQYETIPGSHNRVMLVKYRGEAGSARKGTVPQNPYDLARIRSLSLKTLFDVWEGLGRQTKPEELTKLFLYTVTGYLSTQPVLLLQPRRGQSPFAVAGQMGLSKRLPLMDLKLPRNGWVVETLWAHRGPFLSEEFKKLHAPPEELEVLNRLNSTVLVPIFIMNQLRGILSLGGKRNRQAFSEDDMSLVKVLGSYVVLLLEGLENGKEETEPKVAVGTGGSLREAVRGAIGDLAEVSHSHGIPIVLEEGPLQPELRAGTVAVQKVLLTLLTHILYLSNEGSRILIRIGSESGEGFLRIDYQGSPIQFEKGKEGYNPLIDQLLSGSLKLSDCRKVIESEGGKIVVETKEMVSVRLTLPLR